jgi:Fe2+ transport system protein B
MKAACYSVISVVIYYLPCFVQLAALYAGLIETGATKTAFLQEVFYELGMAPRKARLAPS